MVCGLERHRLSIEFKYCANNFGCVKVALGYNNIQIDQHFEFDYPKYAVVGPKCVGA
jgi:hypothetical protein